MKNFPLKNLCQTYKITRNLEEAVTIRKYENWGPTYKGNPSKGLGQNNFGGEKKTAGHSSKGVPGWKSNKEPGKCWYCEEKWTPQHNCKVKSRMLHLLSVGEEVEEEVDKDQEETEEKNNEAYETPPTSPLGGEIMLICFNAFQGTPTVSTFSLLIKVNGK